MYLNQRKRIRTVSNEESGTIKVVSGRRFETSNILYDRTVLPLTQKMAEWKNSVNRKEVLNWLNVDSENITSLLFDRPNSGGRLLKNHSATWRALDYLYNFKEGRSKDWLDYFWAKNLLNAKSVRNRLKIVKWLLGQIIEKQTANTNVVRMVSLASGSAQGLIETMALLSDQPFQMKALLVDNDPEALEKATNLADKHGVKPFVECKQENVFRTIHRLSEGSAPHIVQMIGLLDYIENGQAVKMMRLVRNALRSGGVFMTCNIFDNPERSFVREISEWEMIYRQPADLIELPRSAGFAHTDVFVEPNKIHGVSVSHKEH